MSDELSEERLKVIRDQWRTQSRFEERSMAGEILKLRTKVKELSDAIMTHQIRTICPDDTFYIKDDELWQAILPRKVNDEVSKLAKG
jgi:hypothetical protein